MKYRKTCESTSNLSKEFQKYTETLYATYLLKLPTKRTIEKYLFCPSLNSIRVVKTISQNIF